ncbi:MAG: IPT/TIG domain-containing protein [Terriglobales bacterium]
MTARAYHRVRALALWFAILPICLPQSVRAGGPKYVAGAGYFNSGTMGVALTWGQGNLSYDTDQGDLSPILPGASADALVADAFSQWTSIPTAAVAANRAGQLAEDVSSANVFVNPDFTITMPADILPSATGTPVGIVYDADGTVTDALLGQGAGSASACFSNAVFGGIDNFATNATFSHALVVMNGNCAQATSQLTDVEYRLVRVLGRILGLDWSQVNDNVLTHQPPATQADYAGFPVMHANDPLNCIPINICYSNPYQPKMDDQAALSRLYPVTAQNLGNFPGKQLLSLTTTRIHGRVLFSGGSGQPGQGMQGVNVVARWIDPGTGLPSRVLAAASLSGFLSCGNAGNPATGFNDSSGQPYNRFGSDNPTVEGFFDLAGLQIPNGGASAQYQLSVEAVDPFWSATVGPYEPWQVQPSGSAAAIVVNVSLGGDVEQDIVMQNSSRQKPDPFPLTSYSLPAPISLGGDWTGSLSPYGDVDYFWFSGQANRTASFLVTALDESGNATENKAQPVIGMWDLSDAGTFPAPANTSTAFNSPFLGVTILNAQFLQTTSFRAAISDLRGDGRPDYRYHARILYGDHVTPARTSAAGGPVTIAGLGFQANTRVTIGRQTVQPLAVNANQITLITPAQPDGALNVILVDPPTSASTILTGALTYGAGPNDNIVLIPTTNPATPIGGQTPNPIRVQVLAADGVTPVPGASVFFTSNPTAAFSACSGAGSCTVFSDLTGQSSTFITPLATGAITITAQLAPASYLNPKQVQTTVVGSSSSLDLALSPQSAHLLQGATANLTLTARVLSNGTPQGGGSVNFQVLKGSAGLNPATATANSNGYANTTLSLTALAGDVQVSACVAPGNAPCVTFYGTAVPSSGLQLQAVAGTVQVVAVGQSLRSAQQSPGTSGGDTSITRNPTPVVLSSSQLSVASDANGLASFQPSDGGFQGALQIVGAATAGSGQVPFALQLLPAMLR